MFITKNKPNYMKNNFPYKPKSTYRSHPFSLQNFVRMSKCCLLTLSTLQSIVAATQDTLGKICIRAIIVSKRSDDKDILLITHCKFKSFRFILNLYLFVQYCNNFHFVLSIKLQQLFNVKNKIGRCLIKKTQSSTNCLYQPPSVSRTMQSKKIKALLRILILTHQCRSYKI